MATKAAGSSNFTVYSRDIPRLAKALRAASPELHTALKTSLLATAKIVADDAKSRAAQPHVPSNIAASVKVSVLSAMKVRVTAGGSKAPTAKALEFEAPKRGGFRHPVFGKTSWAGRTGVSSEQGVLQPSDGSGHAYLTPALAAHEEETIARVSSAVSHILDRLPSGGK